MFQSSDEEQTMQNLYAKSTLIKDKDIQEYVDTIQENKSIIMNNDNHFIFGCNIWDKPSMLNILDMKHVENKTNIGEIPICLCKGYYDSSIFLQLNPIEQKIYHILIQKFWPGNVNIMVRAKQIVEPYLLYNETYVCMHAPKNKYVQKILEKTNINMVTFRAHARGTSPNIYYEDVLAQYGSNNIPICSKSNTVVSGIDTTTILINNNTIYLLQRGMLPFRMIQEELKYKQREIDIVIHFQKEPLLQKKYIFSKPIYTLQLATIEFDKNHTKIIEEIKNKTTALLSSVILIDYKYIHHKLKNKVMGYINISEQGNIDEWVQELYQVLQSIEKKKDTELKQCTKIYLTDVDFVVEGDHYSKDIINLLTKKQKIVIPSLFVE